MQSIYVLQVYASLLICKRLIYMSFNWFVERILIWYMIECGDTNNLYLFVGTLFLHTANTILLI